GEYISFANCGLPYYIGGEITEKSRLTVQTPESINASYNVDVRIFNEVISIDRKSKKVAVKNLRTNETYDESYDKLVLSMGSEPIKPRLQGVDSDKVFTLRNIPDTYRIKDYVNKTSAKSAVIIGGGAIGVEMAENLKNIGLEVTIVEMLDQVIAPLDYDMAQDVQNHLLFNGVNLILGNGLKSIEDNGKNLNITLNDGTLSADMLIMSIGVRPESKLAKDCGLSLNERGCIKVNEHMETDDPDIYAIGDAIEVVDFVTMQKAFVPLAGPANKQGRIAADNICGIKSSYAGTQGSSIIKVFDMTVASTGVNEKTCKRLGLSYDKCFVYPTSHANYYPGATSMSIKTIFEKPSGKVLGAQIVGFDGVDKRCDVFATAIRANMTVYDLAQLELCYAPPYSSAKDPVNMAGFAAENILKGLVKTYHWNDVKDLINRDDVILIDVRKSIEYESSHIDGYINIPLEDIRKKINELDKNKKVYTTCKMGLRSYTACRILTEYGFECYSLSGGYRLYNSIFGKKPTVKASSPKNETANDVKKN
ncbi:MAG: FAD-dependent oxidoreductase, partial [Oscillospiraceae bacterium]|nr:FAD-dependent oxidoreductase [Oscillospiraceae bacterium]